jgi:hypothetical protein
MQEFDVAAADHTARLLHTLEQLVSSTAIDLNLALDQAAQAVALVLATDAVDVLLYQASSHPPSSPRE